MPRTRQAPKQALVVPDLSAATVKLQDRSPSPSSATPKTKVVFPTPVMDCSQDHVLCTQHYPYVSTPLYALQHFVVQRALQRLQDPLLSCIAGLYARPQERSCLWLQSRVLQQLPKRMDMVVAKQWCRPHGCVLATDPGTGKTLMAWTLMLTWLSQAEQQQPQQAQAPCVAASRYTPPVLRILIVIKSPLMSHWKQEATTHLEPSMCQRMLWIQAPDDIPLQWDVPIWIVTLSQFSTMLFQNRVGSVDWLVIDEAHTMGSQTSYFPPLRQLSVLQGVLLLTSQPQKNIPTLLSLLRVDTLVQGVGAGDITTKKLPVATRVVLQQAILDGVVLTGHSKRPQKPTIHTVFFHQQPLIQEARRVIDGYKYPMEPIKRKAYPPSEFVACLVRLESLKTQWDVSKQIHLLQCFNPPLSKDTKNKIPPPAHVFDLKKKDPCSICLNVFHNPKQLLCGHMFCLKCIHLVIKCLKRPVFACPMCRTVHPWIRQKGKTKTVAMFTPLFAPPPPPSPPPLRIPPLECGICQSKSPKQPCRPFACQHIFCRVCQDDWVQVRKRKNCQASCPLCRASPSSSSYSSSEPSTKRAKTTNEAVDSTQTTQLPKTPDMQTITPKERWLNGFFQTLVFETSQQVLIFTQYQNDAWHYQSMAQTLGLSVDVCGFLRDGESKGAKAQREEQANQGFYHGQLQVLILNLLTHHSGVDFPNVNQMVIVDFDSPLHLAQAQKRVGCARLGSSIPTEVIVLAYEDSVEHWMLTQPQRDLSNPSHKAFLEIEWRLLHSMPNTRMHTLTQHVHRDFASDDNNNHSSFQWSFSSQPVEKALVVSADVPTPRMYELASFA